MRGWHFNKIVKYFVKEYGYDTLNVSYLIKKMTAEGKLNFLADKNTLL